VSERIGYARGAFDLFHVGHLNVLRHARSECDRLIAGVVGDKALLRTKGRLPVVPEFERLEIVRGIRFVDEAVLDETDDAIEAWRAFGFTHWFKGDDWRGTSRGRALELELATVGVEVVYFPYTATTSSTSLRRALDALA
jgi:glycerol-3-phosphate cytidylyltransferase